MPIHTIVVEIFQSRPKWSHLVRHMTVLCVTTHLLGRVTMLEGQAGVLCELEL